MKTNILINQLKNKERNKLNLLTNNHFKYAGSTVEEVSKRYKCL